jgi:type II secretory pathway component PulC
VQPVLPVSRKLAIDWSLFRSARAGGRVGGVTHAGKRYRLIGTFSIYSDGQDDEPAVRRAIVADDEVDDEFIVGEGETVGDARIVRVFDDHVTIRLHGIESDLWLSIVSPEARQGGKPADASAQGDELAEGADEDGMGFGEKVGERHWVMQRDRLMDYYRELLDEPDRLLAVFDSMKPVYGDNRRITGYALDVVGEGEFFEAMGMQEGDVVRRVNAVPMTTRSRAEYFIRQFAEKGANAFVFEIERDGELEKHVYQLR